MSVIQVLSAEDVAAGQTSQLPREPQGRTLPSAAGACLQLPRATQGLEGHFLPPACVSEHGRSLFSGEEGDKRNIFTKKS